MAVEEVQVQIGQPGALRGAVRPRVHLALHLRQLAGVDPGSDDQLVPPGHRVLGAHRPVQLDRAVENTSYQPPTENVGTPTSPRR